MAHASIFAGGARRRGPGRPDRGALFAGLGDDGAGPRTPPLAAPGRRRPRLRRRRAGDWARGRRCSTRGWGRADAVLIDARRPGPARALPARHPRSPARPPQVAPPASLPHRPGCRHRSGRRRAGRAPPCPIPPPVSWAREASDARAEVAWTRTVAGLTASVATGACAPLRIGLTCARSVVIAWGGLMGSNGGSSR